MDDEKLYILAIETWGADAQIGMLVEEIGEVLTALNKKGRNTNGCSTDDFVGELVDLSIMLDQMKVIFRDYHWESKKQYKLSRLAERLGV